MADETPDPATLGDDEPGKAVDDATSQSANLGDDRPEPSVAGTTPDPPTLGGDQPRKVVSDEPTGPTRRGDDWPGKAVDLIDLTVDTIRDRVIRPIILVGRAIVFGLLIAALVIVISVAVGVAILRLLDNYVFPNDVWASYLVLGSIVTAVGLFVWTKRAPQHTDTPST